MFSWKTLWKSERIHRLLIFCLFFTLKPLSDFSPSYFNFMPVHTSWSNTVRFQRPGKELHKRSGHGRRWWRQLAFLDLHTGRDHVTSTNWLYQAQRMTTFTLPLMLELIRAGPAPPEAISEYSQHFRVCGFWTNYTPSLLSTINHTRTVAFINTGQEAKIELLGWYQTNTRQTLQTALKVYNLFSIELSTLPLIWCF